MEQAVDNTPIGEMSFWEHLDVLRVSLIKIAIMTVLCGIVAFLKFFQSSLRLKVTRSSPTACSVILRTGRKEQAIRLFPSNLSIPGWRNSSLFT